MLFKTRTAERGRHSQKADFGENLEDGSLLSVSCHTYLWTGQTRRSAAFVCLYSLPCRQNQLGSSVLYGNRIYETTSTCTSTVYWYTR